MTYWVVKGSNGSSLYAFASECEAEAFLLSRFAVESDDGIWMDLDGNRYTIEKVGDEVLGRGSL